MRTKKQNTPQKTKGNQDFSVVTTKPKTKAEDASKQADKPKSRIKEALNIWRNYNVMDKSQVILKDFFDKERVTTFAYGYFISPSMTGIRGIEKYNVMR